MPEIILTNVTKRWGKFYAVDNLNLTIEDNAFITLLGPSGCGKTTTLRMIAGLETPSSGRITIGGKVVYDSDAGINIPASKRRVGFLFQNYALWPNMTVYENISFGLKNVKESMSVVDFTARKYVRLIELLKDPQAMVSAIHDCKNQKGALNSKQVVVKLIDRFEVSQYTAKEILGMQLHTSADPKALAASLIKDYEAKLNALNVKLSTKGFSLNDACEVMQNGAVVTKVRKLDKEEIDLAVRRVSRVVKIGEFMERYPNELSGGQQQRVAIARTLAPEPKVLFMDEPLSNLDAKLRLEMRSELKRLHADTGSTFVYVTHDQLEAMTLATKICLINNGVLQQYDAPLDLYKKPINLFVADFVGNPAINLINAKGTALANGNLEVSFFKDHKATFVPNQPLDWASLNKATSVEGVVIEKENKDAKFKYHVAQVDEEIEDANLVLGEDDFVVAIRPEFLRVDDKGPIHASVYSAMPSGMETTVKFQIGNFLLTGVVFGGIDYKIDQAVNVEVVGKEILIFSRKSGHLLAQGSLKL